MILRFVLVVVAAAGALVPASAAAASSVSESSPRWAFFAFASTQKLSAGGGYSTISFPINGPASYGVDLAQGFEVWYTNGSLETAHVVSTPGGSDDQQRTWTATVAFPAGGVGAWTLHTGTMIDTQGDQADPITWDNDTFATVRVGYPSPPDHVDAVATGQGHVLHLTWPEATDDGGSPITGYEVFDHDEPVGSTSADDRELDLDVAVIDRNSFSVASVNAAGTSLGSPYSPPTPAPALPPATPRIWGIKPGVRSAEVSIDHPDDSMTAAISREVATATPGGSSCVADVYSCTLTGLQPGVTYSVTVVAENSVGASAASAAREVTPFSPPKAPTGVSVVMTSGNHVEVDWQPSSPTGNSSAVMYRVYTQPASSTCRSFDRSWCSLDELTAGVRYRLYVVAYNGVGESAPSVPVQVTGYAPPAGPWSIQATCADDSASVAWSPAAPNGREVTGYVVRATSDQGGTRVLHLPADARSVRVPGLPPASTWHFAVVGVNLAGPGWGTSRSCVIPDPHRLPLRTALPRSTARSTHSVGLRWSPTPTGGGDHIDRYEISVYREGRLVRRFTTPAGSGPETVVRHLHAHTRYGFAVRGHNRAGWGAASPHTFRTTTR